MFAFRMTTLGLVAAFALSLSGGVGHAEEKPQNPKTPGRIFANLESFKYAGNRKTGSVVHWGLAKDFSTFVSVLCFDKGVGIPVIYVSLVVSEGNNAGVVSDVVTASHR